MEFVLLFILGLVLIYLGYALYYRQRQDVLVQLTPVSSDEVVPFFDPVCPQPPENPVSFTFEQVSINQVKLSYLQPQENQNYKWILRDPSGLEIIGATDTDFINLFGVQPLTNYTVFVQTSNQCDTGPQIQLGTITTCNTNVSTASGVAVTVGSYNAQEDVYSVVVSFTPNPDLSYIYTITLYYVDVNNYITEILSSVDDYVASTTSLQQVGFVVTKPNPQRTIYGSVIARTDCGSGVGVTATALIPP